MTEAVMQELEAGWEREQVQYVAQLQKYRTALLSIREQAGKAIDYGTDNFVVRGCYATATEALEV